MSQEPELPGSKMSEATRSNLGILDDHVNQILGSRSLEEEKESLSATPKLDPKDLIPLTQEITNLEVFPHSNPFAYSASHAPRIGPIKPPSAIKQPHEVIEDDDKELINEILTFFPQATPEATKSKRNYLARTALNNNRGFLKGYLEGIKDSYIKVTSKLLKDVNARSEEMTKITKAMFQSLKEAQKALHETCKEAQGVIAMRADSLIDQETKILSIMNGIRKIENSLEILGAPLSSTPGSYSASSSTSSRQEAPIDFNSEKDIFLRVLLPTVHPSLNPPDWVESSLWKSEQQSIKEWFGKGREHLRPPVYLMVEKGYAKNAREALSKITKHIHGGDKESYGIEIALLRDKYINPRK